jgi:hypothetical protein
MAKAKVQRSIRPVRNGWVSELWASPKPFGLGEQHPDNFWEVFRAIWENQNNLGYAHRILDQGVCDGCALGTDYFGTKWVGSIYGLMLTAWGFGGVFGPLLVANFRQATGSYSGPPITIACILLVSCLLPVLLRRQPAAEEVVQAKPVGRV